MSGDNHAVGRPLWPHRDLGAIIQAALHLTFGTLLELIRWQVQPCRNLRMIEQVVVFATGDKGEPSHIGEHGSVAILPVEARASCVKLRVDTPSDTGQWPQAPCAVPPDSVRCLGFRNCRATDTYAPGTPLCVF